MKTALEPNADPANQTTAKPLISVIIPHLNQETDLRRALECLHDQSGLLPAFEIIVVDNGSRRLPEDVCSTFENVRLEQEKIAGPGPARNLGVELARGDIIAFTDADCRPDRKWLSVIEKTFYQNPDTQIVGGQVMVSWLDPNHPTELEAYESIFSFRNKDYVATGYSVTSNMAVRKSVFAAVGPFKGIDVAEDQDWGKRATQLGFRTDFLPEMIVCHPARTSFSQLTKKWDRLIAHHFEEAKAQTASRLLWILRSIAVAGSPLFEVFRIWRSDRVRTGHDRRLALRCLLRIRLYRAGKMIALAVGQDASKLSGAWNRD